MATLYTIGRRLRAARKRKHLSQADVAAAIGCAQTVISELERGAVPKRCITLLAYADLLSEDLHCVAVELASCLGISVDAIVRELTPYVQIAERLAQATVHSQESVAS